MFSFLSRRSPTTAHINAQAITVHPKETLLQAALRAGIDFPHSCRVGGCATCKCRLLEGKVRELTETGYILSDEDLDQGYILACQAVPQGDIRVEVNLAANTERSVSGRVVSQERVTHDITQLQVQLEQPLPYKAGQFASLSVAALDGVCRSYSFATPVRPDAQVSFLVRHVPGGQFSSLVHSEPLVGQRVRVDGPRGDFWLRPSDAPLLFVAGGSGLAPVLAMLTEAAAAGVQRPATLLFGAREVRDLYALDQIQALARRWQAPFQFVPVISQPGADHGWQGARGLVTDQIPQVLTAGSHAYLCGPPPMVDSAVAVLQRQGIGRQHIHADRFTTSADVVSPALA